MKLAALTHVPADALDIGLGKGLVYCKQCGWLLRSQQRGDTPRASQPCSGSPLELTCGVCNE
jgi:hypothetical protein